MNTFSFLNIIKRSFLALFITCFMFVAVYVPQPHTQYANAQQIVNDPPNLLQQIWNGITQTSIMSNTLGSLGLNTAQWSVTSILNGIAWQAAKTTISMIQRSIVRWINSGFQGSPSFIQDLGGFLTNIADETMGNFIQQIGGPLSIVCSPFRLNVQIALSSAYNQSRDANARRCTLTGALQNIRNFIGGDMMQGGWDSWFQISQSPSSYTPYGSQLNASIEAGIRITNAQGQQVNILNWGAGFMSSKVCTGVVGANGPEQKCSISTPGTVIANQLNSALGLGHDSLVTADQINEIIGALMQQLVTQVLTGARGLLGAGGAQGSNAQYTNPTFNVNNYSTGMEIESNTNGRELITNAVTIETQYLNLAKDVIKRYEASYTTDPTIQNRADSAYNEARSKLPGIQELLTKLETLLTKYDTTKEQENQELAILQNENSNSTAKTVAATKAEEARVTLTQTLNDYSSIATTLDVAETVSTMSTRWYAAIAGMQPRVDTTVNRQAINEALVIEKKYQILVKGAVNAYEAKSTPDATEDAAYSEANKLLPDIQGLIIDLQDIGDAFDNAADTDAKKVVLSDFATDIEPNLHTQKEIDANRTKWELIFGTLP